MNLEEKKSIYLDNASTTPTSENVAEEVLKYLKIEFGNPSSTYKKGQRIKMAVESARRSIAKHINANPSEIVFTSGATEANNWALTSTAFKYRKEQGKNHIISTRVEHLSIIRTLKFLESQDFKVTYLPVDDKGNIDVNNIEKFIKPETIMMSMMTVNNETGNIFPIKEAAKIALENNILFHTDAVQAINTIKIDVKDYDMDLMSFSGHKFGAPKGIGALYIKKGVSMPSFIHGGDQERKYRAGTENIPGIIGMAIAMENNFATWDRRLSKIKRLSQKLTKGLLEIKDSFLIGDEDNKIPSIINIAFASVEGESALLMLDMEGVEAASGSACSSGAMAYSHVLDAIGISNDIAKGSIRFSLGIINSEEDIDFAIKKVTKVINKLREFSPSKNTLK